MEGFVLVQLPPLPVVVKLDVAPTQINCVPDKVPALGGAVIVATLVAVALLHPPVPGMVYVITDVPGPTPETSPLVETVATVGLALAHVPPKIVELKKLLPP
jgi:hypothetical protein